ncbi:MAG: 2-amino-4-hydroxy-6-hydroxymethyldihydropteridine diphosphokinase [Rhodospirillaceae bacterium]|nr:2-amino-4-hydroxy-6-hydroxymethyldihydropteridine diphosphokinase [Rhodospirillaceae bacterium]|tara:strand:- start:2566 stop:3081 length:516 start_codon:yes stop_codon:yes gene_type:complete
MIFIGIGGNLPSEKYGSTPEVLAKTLQVIDAKVCAVVRCSPWYRSAPVPVSDQPDYLNAVLELSTELSANDLLAALHRVEEEIGRVRSAKNAARIVDLDLLAYDDQVIVSDAENGLSVPHPRLHERAFVLLPLKDLMPEWVHPASRLSISQLIRTLPADQRCEKIDDLGEF